MNNRYTGLLCVFALLSSLTFSCTDDFGELNTNPKTISADKVDPSNLGFILAGAEYGAHFGQPVPFQLGSSLHSDLYSQYFATSATYFPSDNHNFNDRWLDGVWRSFYEECAPQIKLFVDKSKEQERPVEQAIGEIWRSYSFLRMTDWFGPIIYKSYGNGELSVSYDSQEDIYKDIFQVLDQATSVLKQHAGTTSLVGAKDKIFAGNVDRWRTFANTLRLRMALRVKYVEPALAKEQAEKAVSDGVMEDIRDNALIATSKTRKNPYNLITLWGKEFRMSSSMESVLKGYDDPRLPIYFAPAVLGDSDGDGLPYEGLRNGETEADKTNINFGDLCSTIGPRWLPNGPDTNPIQVMRTAEAYLLRAEGALEGWAMGGSVEELYNNGVRASLLEWEIGEDQISEYLKSTAKPVAPGDRHASAPLSDIPVAFMVGAEKTRQLEQIMTQKWLALFPDSWEAWAELRRTGYPKLYPRIYSMNPDVPADQIVRRIPYTSSEYDFNTGALNAALALPEMGAGDKGSTKLWWDKRP
ncbi:hypothetical protein FUAX_43210 (plasmid) [Fulvitalea axinellae]|uniref:SusD/RagB family nutrient-binding outer membrane lipoprotein n=1 Tax=Fulvitalea axinellae TaxID=1182444 RepID=A0AAU9CZE9_9BACT|nr:hypothetical protein FUAX_43210 [Fulvitalea axinellae]